MLLFAPKYVIITSALTRGEFIFRMLFEERIELMGKAKTAAIIVSGVCTCLVGALVTSYITAPTVGTSVSRKNADCGAMVVSDNDAAALTSGETTAITDSKREKKAGVPARILDFGDLVYVQNFEEMVNLAPDYYEQETVVSYDYSGDYSYDYSAPQYYDTYNSTQAYTEYYSEAYTETTYTENTEYVYYDEAFSFIKTDCGFIQPETEYVPPVTEAVTTTATEYVAQPIEPQTTTTAAVTEPVVQNSGISVSNSDYILLCNVVAHEAGCNWISTYDKAKVVEVVMNRVNSPLYPNTIYGVITAPYQFTGCSSYANLGYLSSEVNQGVIDAVNLYLSDPSQFQHGYFSFYGDGYQNYFS